VPQSCWRYFNLYRSRMGAANGNYHAPDPAGDRIAAKWRVMQRFDRDAFVKSELAKPLGIARR
jgi:hypothetical protein